MKKNTILYILLAFLIVMNGFFLFKHLNKPHQEERNNPDTFLLKELNFNDEQKLQFENLSMAHHDKMRAISNDIKELKDELFLFIPKAAISKEEIDSITTLIAAKEKLKEEEMFYSLRAIQELCDANQKERFLKIIRNARHREGPNRGGPPK